MRRHKRQPCIRCGLCACPPCRERRRRAAGKWYAPPDGGYHGCTPGDLEHGPPPPTPATTTVRGIPS